MDTRVSAAAKQRRPKGRAETAPSEALSLRWIICHLCLSLLDIPHAHSGINSLVTDNTLARRLLSRKRHLFQAPYLHP